ncbi:MAG: methyltransferase domain-containing protein [Vallitaleaceae bacterium]|jgi:trans-aconitate 2-methyltransferase|nr:methyltransferase domain-containing protein [Vallitaleaceae bacterium]
MFKWDSKLYMKFEEGRTLPAIDMAGHIGMNDYHKIIDIGCGPGNSTAEVVKHWPHASITGIDSSTTMLAEAKQRLPNIDFKPFDIAEDLSPLGSYDLVFSNAVIQWLPDHENLIRRLADIVEVGGTLAIGMPNVNEMGINHATQFAAKKHHVTGMQNHLTMMDIPNYYNYMVPYFEDMDFFEKHYYHILPSHEHIIEWYSCTGMKPYLDAIGLDAPGDEDKIRDFKNTVLEEIKKCYPSTSDGNVFLPFRRLFMIGHNRRTHNS